MIRLPLLEGRAAHLDLLHIYIDPFILYGYASSTVFFYMLYKVFTLLGQIRNNALFSTSSLTILKHIKSCSLILFVLVIAAAVYIKLFHDKQDDPAGFLGLSLIISMGLIIVVAVVTVIQQVVENSIEKSN